MHVLNHARSLVDQEAAKGWREEVETHIHTIVVSTVLHTLYVEKVCYPGMAGF